MTDTDTETTRNRELLAGVFAELDRGNTGPWVDVMADDVRWRSPGRSVWSRTFEGKPAVLDMLGRVRVQLTHRVQLTIRRIIADRDHVVVEAAGHAVTKAGMAYDNEYCFVFRLIGGKVVEVTEYMDTQLAAAALTPPPFADRN